MYIYIYIHMMYIMRGGFWGNHQWFLKKVKQKAEEHRIQALSPKTHWLCTQRLLAPDGNTVLPAVYPWYSIRNSIFELSSPPAFSTAPNTANPARPELPRPIPGTLKVSHSAQDPNLRLSIDKELKN
jgi:hypothetical protein